MSAADDADEAEDTFLPIFLRARRFRTKGEASLLPTRALVGGDAGGLIWFQNIEQPLPHSLWRPAERYEAHRRIGCGV